MMRDGMSDDGQDARFVVAPDGVAVVVHISVGLTAEEKLSPNRKGIGVARAQKALREVMGKL